MSSYCIARVPCATRCPDGSRDLPASPASDPCRPPANKSSRTILLVLRGEAKNSAYAQYLSPPTQRTLNIFPHRLSVRPNFFPSNLRMPSLPLSSGHSGGALRYALSRRESGPPGFAFIEPALLILHTSYFILHTSYFPRRGGVLPKSCRMGVVGGGERGRREVLVAKKYNF